MKSFRIYIINYVERLHKAWRILPLKKQRSYMLVFLSAYAVLTLAVIGSIWFEVGKPNKGLIIRHIDNTAIGNTVPGLPGRDSMEKVLKHTIYDRENR